MISRSLIQRACVIFGLIVLSGYLFYIGKGHILLIDTNTVTINGKELRSLPSVTIFIDGKELDPMGRAERAMESVGGPKHTIMIVDDADATKKVEKTFIIPTFLDTVIVSVPAILGNTPAEYWVTRFIPPPPEDAPAERMQREGDTLSTQETKDQMEAPPAP